MKVIALLSALLIPCLVQAQSGKHDDGHMSLHEYYRKLSMPDIGELVPGSCCNERVVHEDGRITGDCRPVRAWMDDNGIWHALVGNKEILIPKEKVIKDRQPPAPDGNSHLCATESNHVYCFVPGQPKS